MVFRKSINIDFVKNKEMVVTKLKAITCIVCLLMLILFSCTTNQDNNRLTNNSSDSISNDSDNAVTAITRYDVYEQGASSEEPGEFNVTMDKNPIDEKMERDLLTQDISSTHEAQIFFDGFIEIWQDELLFSINNLKKYLSDEEV